MGIEIMKVIRAADMGMRPYILRAYFATAPDIAESKGPILLPGGSTSWVISETLKPSIPQISDCSLKQSRK